MSLNSLIDAFGETSIYDINMSDKYISIDPSNSRIGINILNPQYEIDICNGSIKTNQLITKLLTCINLPESSYNLVNNQIYISGKNLMINKLT